MMIGGWFTRLPQFDRRAVTDAGPNGAPSHVRVLFSPTEAFLTALRATSIAFSAGMLSSPAESYVRPSWHRCGMEEARFVIVQDTRLVSPHRRVAGDNDGSNRTIWNPRGSGNVADHSALS